MTPGHDFEELGFIPNFLWESDPRGAREQIADRYSFGGGWSPLDGFKMLNDGRIQFGEEPKEGDDEPQDPPLELIAQCQFRDEMLRLYQHSWLAVIQKDGSFEVSRLD